MELRRLNSNEKRTPVTYENASEALNKIGSWTTWLTGLQTASIAAMAALSKLEECNKAELHGKPTWVYRILLINY